jgi:hypothetical protein
MYEADHAQVLLSIDGMQHADANHSMLEKVMRMCVSGSRNAVEGDRPYTGEGKMAEKRM